MTLIQKFIEKHNNRQLNIHVIGDCLIDEEYQVEVKRIAPESPNVHILKSKLEDEFKSYPGGAANVIKQLNNLNVNSFLVGFLGDYMQDVLINNKINHGHYTGNFIDAANPIKKRFYAEDTLVARWDIEEENYGFENVQYFQNRIKELYNPENVDVAILSDYDKGFFRGDDIDFLNLKQIPTIVDPKKRPLDKWKNCTIFKPNSVEALEITGLEDWKQQCDYFIKELNCKSVVITNQGEGVFGKDQNGYFQHTPKEKVIAKKISGAGDNFIAYLAVATGLGFTTEESAIIAFEASSLYVQNKNPMEIWKQKNKFVKIEDLKERDYKLVIQNGCFDLCHLGHIENLKKSKSLGDRLLVAVNSDRSVAKLKGNNRPILPLEERMAVLAALECVDYVISFDEDTPLELIKEIRPDVLVKGADWKGKEVAGSEFVKEVYFFPLIEGKSTTNIVEKIKSFL